MYRAKKMELPILYRDDYLVAINKPHDLLVHRTKLAAYERTSALQMLRDQLGRYVYPAHRLDRKTGGVLLFALDEETHAALQKYFADKKVIKKYLAMVRGYTSDEETIDYPLKKENGKLQACQTGITTLHRTELALPFGQHSTSRYSLIEAQPLTGRMHQIRRHLDHLRHPIIADRPHGCNKQNKLFKEKFGLMTMMLHAYELCLPHPQSGELICITAPLQHEFMRMIKLMQFQLPEMLAEKLIPNH